MTAITTTNTIDHAIQRFQAHLEAMKHPTKTVRSYCNDLVYWRRWLKDNSIVEQVSGLVKEDVAEYLMYLGREAPGRQVNGKGPQMGLAASSIKRKLAALRKFSTYLLEQEYHAVDITAGSKSPRVPKKEPAFLNQQEYKALLYEAQKKGKARDEAILMTLIQCGLREGELVKLSLPDLSLEKREVRLRGRKGNVDTDIPLATPAVDALSKWLAVRPQVEHDRVFISKTGRPLDERAIRYMVNYYMKKAGIRKQASAHTLRHTFGAFKSAKNVDLKTLQYWMGHKSAETTLHYLHLVKKRAPELMEATSL